MGEFRLLKKLPPRLQNPHQPSFEQVILMHMLQMLQFVVGSKLRETILKGED